MSQAPYPPIYSLAPDEEDRFVRPDGRHTLWWLLLTIWLSASTPTVIQAADDLREATLRQLALSAAASYRDQTSGYTYAPHNDPMETAASTVAINGHILLEAFRAKPDTHWLEHARIAADSLLAHADMNGDGKVGWGRYWNLSGPSGADYGSNTTFARDCTLPRNKPYDDELYDDARILHFLLELYKTTQDRRYLDTARRAIDDTWSQGTATADGKGFAYFKTVGPCDQGWQVKNINMLMAVPLALLALETGSRQYRERAEQLIAAQKFEIARKVDGHPAPNFGYYAVDTMRNKGSLGGYIAAAQTTDLTQTIECNRRTGSGESCMNHLGIEARGLALASHILGHSPKEYRNETLAIMNAYRSRDADLCSNELTSRGYQRSLTACIAYYCALRQLEPKFDQICFDRVTRWGPKYQDTILGLFWGAPRKLLVPIRQR